MKQPILLFLLALLLPLQSFSQILDLGESKDHVERKAKSSKGANLSYGINDEGLAFIMDEGWDGMRVWYFDDNSTCIAFYMSFSSEEGRKFIFDMKVAFSAGYTKEGTNKYCNDEVCYTFSNPNSRELACLVTKR